MNALQSYSSDNESDCESNHKSQKRDPGTNYDNIGMEISEDSEDERDLNQTASSVGPNSGRKVNEKEADQEDGGSGEKAKKGKDDKSKDEGKGKHVGESADKPNRTSIQERLIGLASSGSSTKRPSQERESSSHASCHGSRERDRQGRGARDSRDRDSRDSRDHRDRDRDRDRDSRGRGDRERPGHYSDDRRNRWSHSRDRDRDRRRSRSRSRSRERNRRADTLRKAELMRKELEAQAVEIEKTMGITLPSYYNPATMNPLKVAEQERKKKLLWGNKKNEEVPETKERPASQASLWASTKFTNDSDGKMAEKFKRLMGVKATDVPSSTGRGEDSADIMKKQETLFNSMEKQYEMARLATHTHKGYGLGFSSQGYTPK